MMLLLQSQGAANSGPQFTINAAKGNFFDRGTVTNAADRARRAVHSKFGAYVRKRAMHSMRKRKGASSPGSPPHAHVGLIRKFLFFANDEANRSVVIGPALLDRPTGATWRSEYGGTGTVLNHGKRVPAVWPARPFMRPAFDEELPKLPQMWLDALNR